MVKFNQGTHTAHGSYIRTRKQDIGVSDLIGCSPNGLFCAVEVKAPGKVKDTSEAQKRFIARVVALGGIAICADSLGSLIQQLTLEV